MSNDREDLGYTSPDTAPAQDELFGSIEADPEKRIKFPEKIKELERELLMRRRVYPGLIQNGKLTKEKAERQLQVLQSIIDDYNVRVWPQTRQFVGEWREDAELVTFMGVRCNLMHREELLAIVAFAKAALEEIKP